jgi:hypothetical protein
MLGAWHDNSFRNEQTKQFPKPHSLCFCCYLTNYRVWSSCWEADSMPGSQKMPSVLWDPVSTAALRWFLYRASWIQATFQPYLCDICPSSFHLWLSLPSGSFRHFIQP